MHRLTNFILDATGAYLGLVAYQGHDLWLCALCVGVVLMPTRES